MTKQIKKTAAPTLQEQTMALGTTAQKIRFLAAQGESVKSIHKLLNAWGVTTAKGGELRYQHVRNTVLMPLTTK